MFCSGHSCLNCMRCACAPISPKNERQQETEQPVKKAEDSEEE